MPKALDDESYRALAAFRLEMRRFQRFSEDAARAAGLTAQQHQALLAIRAGDAEGMLIGDLAERLLLRPNSASELADRLEAHDLVSRSHRESDRRQVRIRLTDRAAAALAALSASHRAELRRLRPLLQGLLKAL